MKSNRKLQLLTPTAFVDNLILELKSEPESIKIIYFKFRNDLMVEKINQPLSEALKCGTKLELYLDSIFSRIIVGDGMYLPLTRKKRSLEIESRIKSTQFFEKLRNHGAIINFIKEPLILNKYILPFTNRDHRKVILIKRKDGHEIVYFGGTNFDDGSRNDFMVKSSDKEITEAIAKTSLFIDKNMPNHDLLIECSPDVKIILDRGKPFQSLIFNHAVKLISNAKKEIIFVSQLPPEPALLLHLSKASKRGVNVETIIPDKQHPQVSAFPYNIAYRIASNTAKLNGIKIIHCTKGFTHAKILKVDDKVIIGSHNLSYAGIISGTVELSAEISNIDFIDQINKFIVSLK